ncbi:phage polarity suppression protein, partial [Escherichia coli]|nr:phage polarity suppression protein [Escherichia coli]
MLPSETMIWQPEFTDKTLSRKTGAVHRLFCEGGVRPPLEKIMP